ncbi:CapZ-interacting protein [Larimichthys crocea]|uniref:Uncharacterized protein n=1 Tax=Larimichthys crocea TaxID=215358 RepID=A0ACD3R327_LARCR|nr:CapZ-interacting protein [Larimichthys crocea]
MEEEAPSRRSVAELAGKFKRSAPPPDAAGHESEKPVRRRPPRSLNLPKPQGDDQEPPGVTSPIKPKRNSALIEKLQANLALSPSALLTSPKSPGFRLLPPAFPLPSAGSTQVSTVTTSSTPTPTSPVVASPLTEDEGPASFETPPTVAEGSILSNDSIKGRARHSIRRRPPSRRHRKSSSGDEVGVANERGEDKTAGEGGGEAQTDVVKEDKTDTSTCPEKNTSQEEEISIEPKEKEKKKKEEDNSSTGGEKGDGSSSGRKEEEEKKKKIEGENSATGEVEGDCIFINEKGGNREEEEGGRREGFHWRREGRRIFIREKE